MQLEKMDAFFEARLNGYEEHMMNSIESAEELYSFTASQLPAAGSTEILDLGCGIFRIIPQLLLPVLICLKECFAHSMKSIGTRILH